MDALADKAPLLRDDAVAAGLVDRVGFRDEAYARIAQLSGAVADSHQSAADADGAITDADGAITDADGAITDADGAITDADADGAITDADGADAPPRLFLARYARAKGPSVPLPGLKRRPTIAVITLAGPIVSGRGRQMSPLGSPSAEGDTIATSGGRVR